MRRIYACFRRAFVSNLVWRPGDRRVCVYHKDMLITGMLILKPLGPGRPMWAPEYFKSLLTRQVVLCYSDRIFCLLPSAFR